MIVSVILLAWLVLALLVVRQLRSAFGREGAVRGTLLVLLVGGGWGALELRHRQELPVPEDQTASPPVPSQACFKCHESHYTSWQQTYHRTMTREATPENIKADFNDAVYEYQGATSRMTRQGDRFYIDTIDPEWAAQMGRQGIPRDQAGSAPRHVYSVDRLVGSHWFQQMLHLDEHGRYVRLPFAYHMVEQRWMHINGAFLAPESPLFFDHGAVWNETCVRCHNTRPRKNPEPLSPPEKEEGSKAPSFLPLNKAFPGYRTEVGELGIACEACHGAGERHVRAHQNPARRLAQQYSGRADPTIVNPARLPVAQADDVCAHCHSGQMVPRLAAWDASTQADPFLAGRDLNRFFYRFWSEAQQETHMKGQDTETDRPHPGPLDGRFWGDGTPLTTALEYQGMAMSACYQDGHGNMSCRSCHTMHGRDPNHQLKDGMRTNSACYGCHEKYRDRLVEHTHHAADSPGSLCYNCHMPHQVFSLLDTHRAHRITVPRVRDSVGTGKPHACNLCHLDKSLGWTQEQLGKWYGTTPEPLADDERSLASSVLHLTRSDARSRAVVAGAFSWPAAQQASGRDWPTPLLTRTLEHERYQAVRYMLHRALRSLHGPLAKDYDFQGSPAQRAAQLCRLRLAMDDAARPDPSRYPYLPLTSAGRFADDVFDRLLRTRNDPNVAVNE